MDKMKIGPSRITSVCAGFRYNSPRLLFGVGLYVVVMAFTLACAELALVIRGEAESATRYPLVPFLMPVSALVILLLVILNWISAKRDAWDWFRIGPDRITILRKPPAESERVRLEIPFDHVRVLIFDRSFLNSHMLSGADSAGCTLRYRSPDSGSGLDRLVNLGPKGLEEINSIADAFRKYCPQVQIVHMPPEKWKAPPKKTQDEPS